MLLLFLRRGGRKQPVFSCSGDRSNDVAVFADCPIRKPFRTTFLRPSCLFFPLMALQEWSDSISEYLAFKVWVQVAGKGLMLI